MKKTFLACWLTLVIAGCGGRGYLPIHYYTIDTQPQVKASSRRIPLTLGVRRFGSPSRYQDEMLFRKGELEVGYYEYSRWVERPSEMVSETFVNSLRAAGLFDRADAIDFIQRPDLILNGTILSFDQVGGKGEKAALFEILLELIRQSDGRLIWSRSLKSRVPEDEGGFVRAMSEAVGKVAAQAVQELATFEIPKEPPLVEPR